MIIGNHRNVYKLADVIRYAAYDMLRMICWVLYSFQNLKLRLL